MGVRDKAGAGVPILAAAVTIAVLGGCGSSSSSNSGSGSSASAGSADVSAAQAWLATHQNESTLPYKIPSSSPKPVKGKKVVVLLAGAGSEGGKEAAAGVTAGGKTLGWTVTTVDGQFNPKVWADAIGNATSSKADAIVLDALPPEAVAGPIKQASDAGIKVVSEFNPVPPSQMVPGVLADASAGGLDGGMAQAAWVTADSGGKAKIIFYADKTIALTRDRINGFLTGIKQFCPGCSIVTRFDVDESTMAMTLSGQMAGDIRRVGTSFTKSSPGYVVAPHDVGGLLMLKGIQDAQASDRVKMVSIDALPPVLQDIRNGTVFAGDWAQGLNWLGWSTADQLNRIFSRAPAPSYQGSNYEVQQMMLDAKHINPSGPWTPPYDYQAAFKKLWASGA